MRCDLAVLERREADYMVSIPAGFSDALRRYDTSGHYTVKLFQSLLGFLMRCDDIDYFYGKDGVSVVSIPAGFSDALRPFVGLLSTTVS